jgi:hypothetical protein
MDIEMITRDFFRQPAAARSQKKYETPIPVKRRQTGSSAKTPGSAIYCENGATNCAGNASSVDARDRDLG